MIFSVEAQLKRQQDQLDELSRYARNVARDRSMFEQPVRKLLLFKSLLAIEDFIGTRRYFKTFDLKQSPARH